MIFLALFLCGIISSFAQTLNYFGQSVEMINDNYFLLATSDTIPVDTTFISVKFIEPINETAIESLVSSLNLDYINGDNDQYYRYILPSNSTFQSIIEELDNSSEVSTVNYSKFLEYHTLTPNDPEYPNTLTESQEDLFGYMEMEDAWDYTTGDHSISVVCMDSGFDIDHPDIASGSDGYTNYDYTNSYSFVDNTLDDVNSISHGTRVSSCIAAKMNNSTGLASVAGGWNAQGVNLIMYKISTTGSPSTGYVASAIEDAIELDVDIVNFSFGAVDWYDDDIDDMIDEGYEAGIIFTASVGNINHNEIAWPASHEYVIAVGGSEYIQSQDEERRWEPGPAGQGSNYGEGLEILAPANSWSAIRYGGYDATVGTSFAAPTVAGIIALMKSINPCLSLEMVRDILYSTADKIGSYTYVDGWNNEVGYGRINAKNAVKAVYDMMIFGGETITTAVEYTDEILVSTGDIIIESGGELIIDEDCTLMLGESNKIIVEPGGRLISSGIITAACGGLWEGIEVWGNSTLAQVPYTNQGYVQLREGSQVNRATMGILAGKRDASGVYDNTKNGGIIFATGVTFNNNIIGANIRTYPSSGSAVNICYFTKCDFVTTNDYYQYTDLNPDYFVWLTNVDNIVFKGCTFSNERYHDITNQYQYSTRGTGILAYRSKFYVKEYEAQTPAEEDIPCEFNDIEYGIATSGISSDDFVKVEDAIFTNTYRSIYSSVMNTPTIVNNTFNIPPADKAVGLYIDGGSDFVIEDNIFLSTDYSAGQYGIIVNEDSHENEIYNNEFGYLSWGFSNQGETYDDNVGICLTCNDFHDNIEDISVISNHGICENQGSYSEPAFNLFSLGSQNTYDIYNEPRNINYFVTSSAGDNPRFFPSPVTNPTVNIIGSPTFFSTDSDCLTRYDNVGVVTENTTTIMDLESDVSDIDLVLATLTDNGSTITLQAEVENATPTQSTEVYNDLMTSSEYVSNTVLLSSVKKEYVLNNNMITDVLSVNPQGSKDQTILNELNNRNQPLTQNQWDQVLAGQETIGAREDNIAVKNMLYRDINKLETNITRIYLEDITNPTSSDNAYNRLLQRTDRSAKYLAAFSSLERQNLSLCNSIMSEIYQTLETSEEFYIHQNMVDLITITSDYFTGNDNTFPSTNQVALLTTLVDNGDYPGLLAKNILLEFGLINYNEPIVESTMLKNSIVEWQPVVASSMDMGILIYPNPATETLNINLPEKRPNSSFEIRSTTGQLIMKGLLDSSKTFQKINISNIESGIYTFAIFSNNAKIHVQKITIQ